MEQRLAGPPEGGGSAGARHRLSGRPRSFPVTWRPANLERRAWDSNPQLLSEHHISSVAANHSLTLQSEKNRVFQEMASSWTTTGLHRTGNLGSARLREYTQRSASVDPGLCLNPIWQNDRKGRQPAAPGVLAASGRPAGPLRQAHPLTPLPLAEPFPPLSPHHPRRRPRYFLRISSIPSISGPIRWIARWQFAQRIARSSSLVFTRLVSSDSGARW